MTESLGPRGPAWSASPAASPRWPGPPLCTRTVPVKCATRRPFRDGCFCLAGPAPSGFRSSLSYGAGAEAPWSVRARSTAPKHGCARFRVSGPSSGSKGRSVGILAPLRRASLLGPFSRWYVRAGKQDAMTGPNSGKHRVYRTYRLSVSQAGTQRPPGRPG